MTRTQFLAAVSLAATAFLVSPALAQKSKDTLRYPLSEMETAIDPYLLPGPFNKIGRAHV